MDLTEIKRQEESVRIEQTQKKQIEYTFIGSQKKVPGHRMFYLNLETGKIAEAKIIIDNSVDFTTGKPFHNPRVDIQKNCVYRQALNKKNFIKRLVREGIIKKDGAL